MLLVGWQIAATAQDEMQRLESAWEASEWELVHETSEKVLLENPGSEVARFALASSSYMGFLNGSTVHDTIPELSSGSGSHWHLNSVFVHGHQLQSAYRFDEAADLFLEFLEIADERHSRRSEVQLRLEQCLAHSTPEDRWVPLVVLDDRSSNVEPAFRLFSINDSIGRWVTIPNELRSRHDRKMGFIDQMFVHPRSELAWFASDRKGEGQTDIYEVVVKEDGDFGTVRKMANGINSPYNERTPLVDQATGKLYFSSDRPASLGGFDIFFSELNREPNVEQMPFAFNSTSDDTHFTPSGDGWTAWMATHRDRTPNGQSLLVHSEGAVRHPVEVSLNWTDAGALEESKSTTLVIWDIDAQRVVWDGDLSAPKDSAKWIALDGTQLRALLMHDSEEAYTWTEWRLPAVNEPKKLRYQLGGDQPFPSPQLLSTASWSGPDSWSAQWEETENHQNISRIPDALVNELDLSVKWNFLANTTWWKQASTDERWRVVDALAALEEPLLAPEFPAIKGWNCIDQGLEWGPAVTSSLKLRISRIQRASDLVCTADTENAWTAPCEAWNDDIRTTQYELERGMIWNHIAETTMHFRNIREALTPEMKVSIEEYNWFIDSEEIMSRAIRNAFEDSSWGDLLGTELVWRDWLWAIWKSARNAPHLLDCQETDLIQAWKDLELTFGNPVWGNLKSASRSVELLFQLNEEPGAPAVNQVPPPVATEDGNEQILSQKSSLALQDSIYTVQLGAYVDRPDEWAFLSLQNNLNLSILNNWFKVSSGAFDNVDSAREHLERIQSGGGWSDAFIVQYAASQWPSTWEPFSLLNLEGYMISCNWNESPRTFQFPMEWGASQSVRRDDGTWDLWLGPFFTESHSQKVLQEVIEFDSNAELESYHAETNLNVSIATPSTTAVKTAKGMVDEAPPKVESTSEDLSIWLIRFAEYPNGVPSSVQAALLRIPSTIKVRSIPWGSGRAYMTEYLKSEANALETLQQLKSLGFADARLLPVLNN